MQTRAFDLPPALLAILGENRPATPPQDAQTDTRAYSSPTPWENPAEGQETPHSATTAGESIEAPAQGLLLQAEQDREAAERATAAYKEIEQNRRRSEALGEPEPLQIELDRTRGQLHHLQEAQERETDPDSRERITAAIRAHRARIRDIEDRITAAT